MKKFIIAVLAMTSLATDTQAVYHKNLRVADDFEVMVDSGKIPNKTAVNMIVETRIFAKGSAKHVYNSVIRTPPEEVCCYPEGMFIFDRDLVFSIIKSFSGHVFPDEPIFECDGVT